MLTLVPFTAEHFGTLASWFASESELVQWGGPSVFFPLDKAQLARMLEQGTVQPPNRHCWMAREGDDLVGHVQLGFDWRNGNATLARIGIAPWARGRGLARLMLAPVIEAAFARPEIERLELNVYSFNTPALRTYESLGFQQEGVRRASARVGSERWDTVIMALLRSELTDGERAVADAL